jgi:hypothetical protein
VLDGVVRIAGDDGCRHDLGNPQVEGFGGAARDGVQDVALRQDAGQFLVGVQHQNSADPARRQGGDGRRQGFLGRNGHDAVTLVPQDVRYEHGFLHR